MKKVVFPLFVCLLAFAVVSADAQPKKIALSGRISWCPGSAGQSGTDDRDFDVMYQFSMDDEILRYKLTNWGYFPILMPDYVVQQVLEDGLVPFPIGDDADYRPYVNEGIYMAQPTFFEDHGYALVINTGTCWSSIGPPLKNVSIPVIQGEHANLGTRGKIGDMGMFQGSDSGDIYGVDTIILTEEGKSHPIMAGLPDEIVIYGDGPDGPPANSNAWAGIWANADVAAPGVVVLAVWAGDTNANKAAIAVMEAGGLYDDNSPAPARRVMPFVGTHERPANDADPTSWVNTYDYLTPEGNDLVRRYVRWALGEDPTPVSKWKDM